MLDFELLKKTCFFDFVLGCFCRPQKEGFRGRCFYFFRIKGEKKEEGEKRRKRQAEVGEKKKRMYQKKEKKRENGRGRKHSYVLNGGAH